MSHRDGNIGGMATCRAADYPKAAAEFNGRAVEAIGGRLRHCIHSANANSNDKRQHHGVLNGRGPILISEQRFEEF